MGKPQRTPQCAHRSTSKQTNKPHNKGGKKEKKSAKATLIAGALKAAAPLNKNDRKNTNRMRLLNKKEKTMHAKMLHHGVFDEKKSSSTAGKPRCTSGRAFPNKVVLLLQLHHSVDTAATLAKFADIMKSEGIEGNTDEGGAFSSSSGWHAEKSAESGVNFEVFDEDKWGSLEVLTHRLPRSAQYAPLGKNQSISFVTPVSRELSVVLDIAKCCDLIMILFGNASYKDSAFDELGYETLSALKLQGLPSVIGCACETFNGSDLMSAKELQESRKFVKRYFYTELEDEEKFFVLHTKSDYINLLRAIGSCTPRVLTWRESRGYLLGEDWYYDANARSLIVLGRMKGLGLSVDFPVHITGAGDFFIQNIGYLENEEAMNTAKHHLLNDMIFKTPQSIKKKILSCKIAATADSASYEALNERMEALRPFDPLAGEQTWPLEEEMKTMGAKYGEDDGSDEGEEERHEEAAFSSESYMNEAEDEEEDEAASGFNSDINDEDFDHFDDFETKSTTEEKKLFEMQERAKQDLMFPDEVDTPVDHPARLRFQKYRGLKNFKTSPWDAYESLPTEYGRIHDLGSHRKVAKISKLVFSEKSNLPIVTGNSQVSHTQTSISAFSQDPLPPSSLYCSLNEEAGKTSSSGALSSSISGHYCCVQIPNVDVEVVNRIFCNFSSQFAPENYPSNAHFASDSAASQVLILSNVFPFERKVTVVNFSVTCAQNLEEPIRSKEKVEIHCGFRKLPAKPIFSEYSVGNTSKKKFKYERFLHPGATSMMSIYCSSLIPPSPVVVFKECDSGVRKRMVLAAWGLLHSWDVNRLIIKRIVLTGYPIRITRKRAIVRYMFFTPEDIRYFKSIELHSKKGLRGHIEEPFGTHGHMKCLMNDHIASDDTICMYLYKRVFPKWFPPTWGGVEGLGPHEHPPILR